MLHPELRPEAIEYPAHIRAIREQLDLGLTVFVVHNEYMTRKELLIVPKSGMVRFGGPYGTGGSDDWFVVIWIEFGSCWASMQNYMHWSYIAEKMRLTQWPGDAKSIAALVQNITQVGSNKPLVKADDL